MPTVKHTWASDTLDALIELGGQASLHEIYEQVRRIRADRGDTWPPKAKEIIRKEIKFRAKESSAFLGKEEVYYPVFGIGGGVWALKQKRHERDHFSKREIKDIPFKDRYHIEGELKEKTVLAYSRNRANVSACKERDGYTCRACSFSCDGKIVEAHHLEPLSLSKRKKVGLSDLITLCPTCHRVAHLLIDMHFEKYADAKALIQAIRRMRR